MTANRETNDQATSQRQPQSPDQAEQLDDVADAETRELWQRYLEQQARRSCPGCGEAGDAVL